MFQYSPQLLMFLNYSAGKLYPVIIIIFCLNVYKSLKELFPPAQCNIFTRCGDSYGGYKLLSSTSGNLVLCKVRSESGKKSVHFRGAKVWNELPNTLKNPLPPSITAFKNMYNSIIILFDFYVPFFTSILSVICVIFLILPYVYIILYNFFKK